MKRTMVKVEGIYRSAGLPEATIEALMGYTKAVHENAQLSITLREEGENEKADACLRMALGQLSVLCGGAPGVCL